MVTLRGQMWYEGALQFLAALVCAYPPALGVAMGHLPRVAVDMAQVAQGACLPRPYGQVASDDGNPLFDGMPDCMRRICLHDWAEEDMIPWKVARRMRSTR